MTAPLGAKRVCYFFIFWFPVILYSAIIFYVSSLSSVPTPLSGFQFDKAIHMVEYAVLGFLLARAFNGGRRPLTNGAVRWAFVAALLYGLSDEYHQSFVAGRDASWLDLVADGVGGYAGARIYAIFVQMCLEARWEKGGQAGKDLRERKDS